MMNVNNEILKIKKYETAPGEKRVIMIPLPELYDGSPMYIPIHVYCGKTKGPTLIVLAAIHGDEINGVEIIHRLLKRKILNKLAGNLIAIPIANIYGFIFKSRYLMDRRDLNRAFPGSEKGSIASRLANFLLNDIISLATHVIDLHSGALYRSNVPQVRASLECDDSFELAKAFAAPVILDSAEIDGSLRSSVNELGIPYILYEAGEALRFDEFSIKVGVRGILNVMTHVGMINTLKQSHKMPKGSTVAYSSKWIRAPSSGLLRPLKSLGKTIEKDESIGIITDPLTMRETSLDSPIKGIVIGQTNLPMIHEGEALFHIASVEKAKEASERISELEEYYDDE